PMLSPWAEPITVPGWPKPTACRSPSSSRQSLKDVDGAALAHGVGEPRPIADHAAVDEDGHVPAQGGLVVEHVAARLRIFGEDVVQHLPHGPTRRLRLRAGDVALDVGREDDLGHRKCFRSPPGWRPRNCLPQGRTAEGSPDNAAKIFMRYLRLRLAVGTRGMREPAVGTRKKTRKPLGGSLDREARPPYPRGLVPSRTARNLGNASSQTSVRAMPTKRMKAPPPKRIHCTSLTGVSVLGSFPSPWSS